MSDLLTVNQLAETFQLSPRTIYRALERAELRGSKLGSRWRIRIDDANAWFDEHVPPCRQAEASKQQSNGARTEGSLRALLTVE
jgi:excisionase family DNA binding protein